MLSFQIFAIVFSTPENLLVGMSAALGMTGSQFLTKNVFWENAVVYLRNSECKSFKPLPLCSAPLKTVLLGITGALGTKESHFFSVLRKCCGVLNARKCIVWGMSALNETTFWMLEHLLLDLCHCIQHPWKLTSRMYWSSRNERKPLSKLNHDFRKCSGVSQKQWMLELSNLCHCVQHHWKLTSRDYWSSRNKRKPLSKLKHVLRKCSGVFQKHWMLEILNHWHCVQHPWKLSSRDYLTVLGMTESHFLS